MQITKTIFVDAQTDDDPDEIEVEFPAVYEMCHRCEGHGKHSNPSIDGHGITEEEWVNEWDEEGREMYLRGGYDITCTKCKGVRVVAVIDEDSLTPEQKKYFESWQEQEEDRMQMIREDAYTYRMESGGYDY